MEVVGAGANVLAFVGLSANLVRGIKDVHRFFKDFKDAPEDAKRVAEHIKLLNDILVETHIAYKDGSLDPDLTDAIRPCERIIDRLRARVVCFRTEDMGTRQKLWGKFKNAVNKKELNEDLQALDRACDALQRWCHKEDRLMQVGMHDKIQETHSKVTEILEDTRAMRTLIGDNPKDTKMLKYAEITCDETLRTGENVDRICVATSQIQDSVRTQCSIQESGFSRLDEHHDRLKVQVDQILEILQAAFNNTVEDFIQTPPHSPNLVCQAAHLAQRTPLLVQRLRQRPTLDHGYDEMDQMAHLVQSLDNGQTMDPDSHIMDGLGDLTHRLYERVHQTLQSRGTHMGYRMFITPTIGPEMGWPPRDTAQQVHTNPTHRRLGKHRAFSTGLQLYNNDRFSSGFFPIAPRREQPGITALISRSDESIDFHDAEDFRRSTGLSQQKTGAESDTYWIRQFAKLTRRTKWNLFLFHVVLKTVNASHTKRKNRARTRAKRTGMSKDDDDRDEILRTTYRNFTFALAQWFASSSGASDGSYGYELKFTTGFNGFAPEGWSCDFKGFHYRPRKGPGGRVFTLCLKAEPGKLRRLLATGRANVRDVTLEGKNMWHFLAKAADRFMKTQRDPVELACVEHRRRKRRLQAFREGKEAPVKSKPKEDTRSDDEFMRDWLEMIDLLLEQGLEPSRRVLLAFKESLLELNYTLDEFTECRLISKLLTGAKYNPFTALGGPIRVYLYQSGYGTCYGILPLHILRAFVLQDEWPIDWARDCITAAISLAFHWSDAADWWRWLEFWVTKDSDDVDEYLDRKLALLKLLVWADAHGPMKSFPVHHALWWAIYGAAEVISVLQYHPDSFREQPYVRDRAAKLWSVERYLGDALKIYIRAANKRLKYFRHHPTLLRYIEGACLAGVGNVKGNRILVDVWDHVYDVLEGELCIGPTTTTTMTTTTQNDTNEPSLELDYGYDYEYDYDYPYVYDDMNLDEALEEAIIEPRDWDVGSVGSVNSVVDGRCSDFSSSSSSDESESYNELDNGRCRRRPRQWGVDGLPKYRWSRQFDVYAWVKTNEMIHRKTTRR